MRIENGKIITEVTIDVICYLWTLGVKIDYFKSIGFRSSKEVASYIRKYKGVWYYTIINKQREKTFHK